MPAGVWGLRSNNILLQYKAPGLRNEIEAMYGASRKLMFHASVIGSNANIKGYAFDGVNAYVKYRFYNKDGYHKHFRLALFARLAYCNNREPTTEINLEGDNTGFGLGFIVTKLIHKVAISNSLQFSNGEVKKTILTTNRVVQQFTDIVSIGCLLYPKKYTSYRQTNINVYLEALITNASYHDVTRTGYMYSDIAPGIQFIFNSQTRLDFSYRKRLNVTDPQNHFRYSFLLRLQHDFLN
jgi:hypothetical protein